MDNNLDILNLEKIKWTEQEFDQMQWHDNKIYAIGFGLNENELAFDIDYILKWINPEHNENNFKFIVVPATLIFRNVYDVNISLSLTDLVIDDLYKNNPVQPKNGNYICEQFEYEWTIETTNGEITFKSVGYNQYARQVPKLITTQSFNLSERGGISFAIF